MTPRARSCRLAGQGAAFAAALRVLRRLQGEGHTAWFVGGAVRDALLGRSPKDWDVVTDASLEDLERLFPRVIPVGKAFGVARVLDTGDADAPAGVEVARFRTEAGYADGRRPDQVTFAGPAEDAARRDFTVNGLFYDPITETLTDYVGGLADLEARRLRAIGDPEERFGEDHLRMLRAIRLAVQLDFTLDPAIGAAIRTLAPRIRRVSGERVREELAGLLGAARRADGVRWLDQFGLLAEILPEVTAGKGVAQPPEFHPEGDVFVHTLLALEQLREPSFELALATLLHDIGKPATFTVADRIRFHQHDQVGERMAVAVCRRLRLSREQTERIAWLVRKHLVTKDARQMRPATVKRYLAHPYFDDLLALTRADVLASNRDLSQVEYLERLRHTLPPEAVDPPPLLQGRDLLALGLVPGPRIGQLLRALRDEQLEGRITDRAQAEAFIRSQLRQPRLQGASGAPEEQP